MQAAALPGLTAFARDVDGGMLCIEEASGLVVSWDAEDKAVCERMQVTLG